MNYQIINCRKELKKVRAELEALKTQKAQELLDIAGNNAVLDSVKQVLKDIGEEVKPHDTVESKIKNIVAAKNSALNHIADISSMPASDMLKKALRVILNYKHNIPGKETAAALFLNHPITKTLLREMNNETRTL